MRRWQRFSDGACDVVLRAREEARALGHEQVGVEHLLVGLVREPDGVGGQVLRSLELPVEEVRGVAVNSAGVSTSGSSGELAFTADADDVLAVRALMQAMGDGGGAGVIKTEHLLLGLVYDDEAAGARVLREVGVQPAQVRARVYEQMPAPRSRPAAVPPRPIELDRALRARLTGAVDDVLAVAQQEARSQQRDEVCTEHLLLGLLRVEESKAARILRSCGVTDERVREQLQAHAIGSLPTVSQDDGELALSRLAVRALERAAATFAPGAAINSEHVLFGIAGVSESAGARVLAALGVSLKLDPAAFDRASEERRPLAEAVQLCASDRGLRIDEARTLGYSEAITEAHHTAQMRGRLHASLDDLVIGALHIDEGWPMGNGARDRLLDGAWPLAGSLVRELADQLDRPIDAGDLLVVLASVPDGIAARALHASGIDAGALADAVQQARRDPAHSALLWPPDLVTRLASADAARASKSELQALAERQDDLRDQFDSARDDVEQRRDALLDELRDRLGLRVDHP